MSCSFDDSSSSSSSSTFSSPFDHRSHSDSRIVTKSFNNNFISVDDSRSRNDGNRLSLKRSRSSNEIEIHRGDRSSKTEKNYDKKRRKKGIKLFEQLPDAMIYCVFLFLNPIDLSTASRSNRLLYRSTAHPQLWRPLMVKQFIKNSFAWIQRCRDRAIKWKLNSNTINNNNNNDNNNNNNQQINSNSINNIVNNNINGGNVGISEISDNITVHFANASNSSVNSMNNSNNNNINNIEGITNKEYRVSDSFAIRSFERVAGLLVAPSIVSVMQRIDEQRQKRLMAIYQKLIEEFIVQQQNNPSSVNRNQNNQEDDGGNDENSMNTDADNHSTSSILHTPASIDPKDLPSFSPEEYEDEVPRDDYDEALSSIADELFCGIRSLTNAPHRFAIDRVIELHSCDDNTDNEGKIMTHYCQHSQTQCKHLNNNLSILSTISSSSSSALSSSVNSSSSSSPSSSQLVVGFCARCQWIAGELQIRYTAGQISDVLIDHRLTLIKHIMESIGLLQKEWNECEGKLYESSGEELIRIRNRLHRLGKNAIALSRKALKMINDSCHGIWQLVLIMLTSLHITSDLLSASNDENNSIDLSCDDQLLAASIRQLSERLVLMKSLAIDLCDIRKTALWIQSITGIHSEWINRFTAVYHEWSERGSRLGIDDLTAGLSVSQMSWINDYHRWKSAYYPTLIGYCNTWKSEFEDGKNECTTLLSQSMRWITAAQQAVDDYSAHKRTNLSIPRINEYIIPPSVSTTSVHNNQPTPMPIAMPLTPFAPPQFSQAVHDQTLNRFLLQTDNPTIQQPTPSLLPTSAPDTMDDHLSSIISNNLSNSISASFSNSEEFEQEIANVVSSSSVYSLSNPPSSNSSSSAQPFNEMLMIHTNDDNNNQMVDQDSYPPLYESLSVDILSFPHLIDDDQRNDDEWEENEDENNHWNDYGFSSHTIMGI